MKTVLIVDVETTGLDPAKDQIIELAWARWSVEDRCLVDCASELVYALANPAEAVNGIPAALLLGAGKDAPGIFREDWHGDEPIVAHNAAFDRSFITAWFGAEPINPRPWICTMEDLQYPKPAPSRSLTAIALAHGCAVVAAHRAINDVLLLARLFESIPDIDVRLDAALAHAQLPKAWLTALVPFDRKDEAKAAGFHWVPERKEWRRYMTIADAAAFPFAVRQDALNTERAA